jgi:hypothetical protein
VDSDDREPYPLLETMALAPPPHRLRRLFGPAPKMPPPRPGSCLVAQVGNSYQKIEHGWDHGGGGWAGIDALHMVSTSQRLVSVEATLPSFEPGRIVRVGARFRCRVDDPVELLVAGVTDVEPLLVQYLVDYPGIRMACLNMPIRRPDEWYTFKHRVIAMFTAYSEVIPLMIDGMDAALIEVEVGAAATEPEPVPMPMPEPPEQADPGPAPGSDTDDIGWVS